MTKLVTATVELTERELAGIQQKRKQEADQLAAQELADRQRREKQEAALIAKHKKIQELGRALEAADTTGVLTVDSVTNKESGMKLPTFSFEYKGRICAVDIERHKVYSNSRFSIRGPKSAEVKYKLCGQFTDYNDRWYKNPNTVIKKIIEWQEIAQCQEDAEKIHQEVQVDTLRILNDRYEHCEIVFVKKGSYDGHRYYDSFRVNSPHGMVRFRGTRSNEGGIDLHVLEAIPKPIAQEQLVEIILAKPE